MPSHEMIQYLMEQRHLQQSDLVELLGSRSQVSLLVNGKRSISKGRRRSWQSSSTCRLICSSEGFKQYAIVIERAPGTNYSAYVPDLPGCVATGDTMDEVRRNIQEAIGVHLEA